MHAHKSTHIILKKLKALLLNDLHEKDREGSLPVIDKYSVNQRSLVMTELEILFHRKFLVCFSHAILTFRKEVNLASSYLSQWMHLSPKSPSLSEQGTFHHWGHCFRFMLWILQVTWPLMVRTFILAAGHWPWHCSFLPWLKTYLELRFSFASVIL